VLKHLLKQKSKQGKSAQRVNMSNPSIPEGKVIKTGLKCPYCNRCHAEAIEETIKSKTGKQVKIISYYCPDCKIDWMKDQMFFKIYDLVQL